jgi:hypothetical protein
MDDSSEWNPGHFPNPGISGIEILESQGPMPSMLNLLNPPTQRLEVIRFTLSENIVQAV